MKKILLQSAMLFVMAVLATSCHKGSEGKDSSDSNKKDDAKGIKTADPKTTTTLRIAYVDLDTVQAHYTLCTELEQQLNQKSLSGEKELQAKQRSLEQHYNSIQQKYNSGAYSSEAEFQNEQANLQKEQEEGAKRQSELSADIQKKQMESLKQVTDSIDNFIKDYNKGQKYDFILVKSTTLYADPAYDITQEIIDGLNKRYETSKKK